LHLLEVAERGGHSGGWILEVVARQPDLLSRVGKGAQEGNKPGVSRVRGRASGDGVVGDAKSALVVRLVQAHVHPSAVLLVPCRVGIPGALLQERIGDLVVNVLLWSTFWFASCTRPLMDCSQVAWQKRMSW